MLCFASLWQNNSAWVLSNIAAGTTEQALAVISAGAVPVFVQLLTSSDHDVRKHAVWTLRNIAGDSAECRDAVLHAGALPPLLELCTVDVEITLLREVTPLLSNLCRSAERTWWR